MLAALKAEVRACVCVCVCTGMCVCRGVCVYLQGRGDAGVSAGARVGMACVLLAWDGGVGGEP